MSTNVTPNLTPPAGLRLGSIQTPIIKEKRYRKSFNSWGAGVGMCEREPMSDNANLQC